MYEYKVITERDSRLAGTFDPQAIEDVLNHYAADGWRLAQSVLAASLWKSMKAEVVLILERPVPAPT